MVGKTGSADGFNADPNIHIPLPDELQQVQSALRAVGMSGLADEVELKLNRAAEAATPKAKEIFWQSISEMTLEEMEHQQIERALRYQLAGERLEASARTHAIHHAGTPPRERHASRAGARL